MLRSLIERARRTLRWSERFTQTDMVYLAGGGGMQFAGQIVASLSGLALSVAFAHLVPKDVYGTYRFVLSAAGMLSAFSLTGLAPAIARAAARGFEGTLPRGFALRLKWNVFIAIGGAGASIYYFLNGNTELALGMLIAAAFVPFLTSFSLYAPFLEGKKNFRSFALLGMVGNLAPALSVIAAMTLTSEPVWLVLAYYVSMTATLGSLYIHTLRAHVANGSADESLVTQGKHLSLVNVISMIADQLDKVLIFHFLGAAPLAVYTFALAPTKQLQGINKIAKSLVLPKLAVTDIPTIKRTLPRKVFLYFLAVAAAVAAYIAAAPFFYRILFPQYMESVLYSQIAALTLLFVPVSILRRTFTAHFKKKELYTSEIAVSVILVVSIAILVPLFGIWGAIAAMFMASVTDAIVGTYLFFRLDDRKGQPTHA